MSFLSSWILYGLSALSLPILIHLWQRRKVIQIPFSTLRFLKIVAARTSRSAKLENILLLLLRCLILAFVILAAARPIVSTNATKLLGGNVPRSVALVIDHSMSMGYIGEGNDTRLDLAKREARAVVDDLKPGDEAMVVAASDRAQMIVAEPTVDHDAVRKAIESIQLTEDRTDFSSSFREARKAIAKNVHGAKQIFLFTDGQESGWQFEKNSVFDDAWRQMNPKFVVVRTDELSSINASVSKVSFITPFAAAGALVRGSVVVQNFSPAALHDVVEISAGGEKLLTKPAEIPPGSAQEIPIEFSAPMSAGRWLAGEARLSGDHLPADDVFHFLLPVYQPPKVLIVETGAGPEKTRPAFFLRKALTAGAAGAPVKTVSPAELDDLAIDSYSAVFLAAVPEISDRAAVRLDRYLQAGGTVVFFPSDQTNLASVAKIDWMPAKPVEIVTLPTGRLSARAIEPAHPLFVNSWDANTPFPALPQARILRWKLASAGRVLLALGDDFPFIIYGERGPGRVIIVNASPDRAWGDFPLTSAFLPLVQQIARLSVARSAKDASFVVGDPVPQPASLPHDQALTVKSPGGETDAVGPGAPLLERAEHAGLYAVSSPGEGVIHEFVVNPDPRESNLAPISESALGRIVPHESAAGLDALRLWLLQSRGLEPLWPFFVLLAVAAFFAEALYANHLAGKRAQGEAGQIRTGRLNKRRMGQPFRDAVSAEQPQETPP